MLQALLALALVIAFLPVLANKTFFRNLNRENVAIEAQIMSAWDAARAYVYEEYDNFPDGIKILSDEDFSNALEPFGLPLGFIPVTPLGQKISLIISKEDKDFLAILVVSGGNLSLLRKTEIMTRIGFWAAVIDEKKSLVGKTGGWELKLLPNKLELDPDDILIRVPEDVEFSELVSKSAKNPEKNMFHTNLLMDGNNLNSVGLLSGNFGEIKNISASDFVLSGNKANKIGKVSVGNVWFSSDDGNPLTITRSDFRTGIFSASSIANYGNTPSLTAGKLKIHDFNMTAGRVNFSGPKIWEIKTSADFTNIVITTERLTLSSFIDASRGQDVFLSSDSSSVETQAGSGINVEVLKTDNIILRDQISSDLLAGGTGASLLEIRPAGTSSLPDILLDGLNNNYLKIPLAAIDNTGKIETCASIISRLCAAR